MYLSNQSSYYQAYDSVGALSKVDIDHIQQEQNIDFLQNLCLYINQMKINPLWYESQSASNKLKLLRSYQLAVSYSKNLSAGYQRQINNLESNNNKLAKQNQETVDRIKQQKQRCRKMKESYKLKKYKKLKDIHDRLKTKLREQQQQNQNYQHSQTQSFSENNPNPQYHYPPELINHQYQLMRMHQNLIAQQYNSLANNSQGVPPAPQSERHSSIRALQQQVEQIQQLLMQQQLQQKKQQEPQPQQYQRQSVNSSKNNRSAKKDTGNMQIKKMDSVLVQEEEEERYQQQHNSSLIINRVEIVKPQNIKYSGKSKNSNKQIKQSVKNIEQDDIGNLTAQSKKTSNSHNKKEIEQVSNQNIRQSQQGRQFDSIAKLRIAPQSNIAQNGKTFQSKIFKKQQQGLKKRPSVQDQILQKQEEKEKQVKVGQSLLRSKFSKDAPSPQNVQKLFQGKGPQRNSLSIQKSKNISESSGEEDMFHLNLNANSRFISKPQSKVKQKGQDFSNIIASTKIKKNQNKIPNTQSIPAEKMFQNPPVRKSHNGKDILRISQVNSEALENSRTSMLRSATNAIQIDPNHLLDVPQPNVYKAGSSQKAKSQIEQNQNDILSSNVGRKANPSNDSKAPQVQTLFQSNNRPKRASHAENQNKQQIQEKGKTPPQLQKPNKIIQEKQQEGQNYSDSSFEMDDDDLLVSKLPISKQQKKQSQETKKLQIPKIQKSQVDISISSAQSLREATKYLKIKDETFKLKTLKASQKMEQNKMSIQSSEDIFDFIPFMPLNSVIAKRPPTKSQILKPSKIIKDPQSLKKLPANTQTKIQSSEDISIHLLSPNHEDEKLLARKNPKTEIKKQQPQIKSRYQEQLDHNLPSVGKQGMKSKVLLGKKTSLIDHPDIQQLNEQIPHAINDNLKEQDAGSYSQLIKKRQLQSKKKPSLEKQMQKDISKKEDPSKFDNTLISKAINNVCEMQKKDFNDINKVKSSQKALQNQINQLGQYQQRKRQILQKIKAQEKPKKKQTQKLANQKPQIQKQQKPNSNYNDSLKYSQSLIKQPTSKNEANKNGQKKIESSFKDLTQSIDFRQVLNNPYTPTSDIKGESLKKEEKPENKKGKELESILQKKPQQKPNISNPFLLQNKSNGTKQQDILIKNAREGLNKFDRDDPLNSEQINKNLKKGQQQVYQPDQW